MDSYKVMILVSTVVKMNINLNLLPSLSSFQFALLSFVLSVVVLVFSVSNTAFPCVFRLSHILAYLLYFCTGFFQAIGDGYDR